MPFYKILKKLDYILSNVEEKIIFTLLAGMLAVVFLGVLNRISLQIPMSWSEEVARYLMIWVTFIGASLGLKRSVHISVDALILSTPKSAQRFINLFGNIIGFTFCILFLYIGIEFIGRMINSGQLSPALRIPIYFAYAAVPSGFFLMSLRYLASVMQFFFDKDSTSIDSKTSACFVEGSEVK
ncbi:TRAP transporter small permease [Marinobacterium lacunae]|uniref:TRAP transporter small permease n=1 Tax=Marinobacterium lacunae TaxID=1232683 RepID=UPI0005604D0A|nr:TRAP transporter small permease [Marinobacterium lacunae]